MTYKHQVQDLREALHQVLLLSEVGISALSSLEHPIKAVAATIIALKISFFIIDLSLMFNVYTSLKRIKFLFSMWLVLNYFLLPPPKATPSEIIKSDYLKL